MQLYLAIFDIDGVLLDNAPFKKHFEQAELKMLAKHGIRISPAKMSAAWKRASFGMGFGPDELLAARMRLFETLKIPDELLGEYERIDRESFAYYKPMEPDMRNTLRKIKKLGVYLAALTDTVHSQDDKKFMLKSAGLGDVMDEVFVPMDTGYQKPASEAYKAVLENFKAEPENAIFVGHDKDEIDGAKLLGISTISYKHRVRSSDYHADSFVEIYKIIKALKMPDKPE
ncbi:MAG: HAD family hydrolase [Candidatus Marsarchaeota archaeon]|nr:HAD family hydrolase [Candidatus Marsarchaeota archaeon]